MKNFNSFEELQALKPARVGKVELPKDVYEFLTTINLHCDRDLMQKRSYIREDLIKEQSRIVFKSTDNIEVKTAKILRSKLWKAIESIDSEIDRRLNDNTIVKQFDVNIFRRNKLAFGYNINVVARMILHKEGESSIKYVSEKHLSEKEYHSINWNEEIELIKSLVDDCKSKYNGINEIIVANEWNGMYINSLDRPACDTLRLMSIFNTTRYSL